MIVLMIVPLVLSVVLFSLLKNNSLLMRLGVSLSAFILGVILLYVWLGNLRDM